MSEEIASADALLTENGWLREQLHRATVLLGRLDYFLETHRSQPELIRARQATQLRREIAAFVAPKRPTTPEE